MGEDSGGHAPHTFILTLSSAGWNSHGVTLRWRPKSASEPALTFVIFENSLALENSLQMAPMLSYLGIDSSRC